MIYLTDVLMMLTRVNIIMIIKLIVAAVIVVKILACFRKKPPDPL